MYYNSYIFYAKYLKIIIIVYNRNSTHEVNVNKTENTN